MKISGFRTRAVRLPRESGPLGGGAGLAAADFVTLQIHTDAGIDGIAFAGYVSSLLTKALKLCLDALAEQTLGEDPLAVDAISARLFDLGGVGAPAGLVTIAIAAIDVALWDLKGKAMGQPLYRLLGGLRDRVPTYASGHLWRNYDLNALAETTAKLVAQGFRAMKFRLGAEANAARELARVRVMREAAGQEIDLMVDINQGWSVPQAVTIGRHLAEYDLYWLEDPVHHQDYAGLAQVAQVLDTPITAGEYQYGLQPLQHLLEFRSVDILMVDLMRVGGLSGFVKAAHLAEAYNRPVVSHLATEILAHATAAAPNGLTVEYMPWSFALFQEVPKVEDGMLVLSERPGLGLEFDEAALGHFAME
ncbi:MAG: mandelate racemase/muconate lactonizing enzyme family protein [Dehalococcoidia bacterium]